MDSKTIHMTTEIVGTATDTYEIKRTWDENKPKCVVIELYPTIATNTSNIGCMDLSTMHLMNHLSDLGDFGSLSVCNLFAKICVNGKPSATTLQRDNKNLEYISCLLDDIQENTPIVLAWGNSLATNKTANEMKINLLKLIQKKGKGKEVKSICAVDFKTDNNEFNLFHPLFLGIRAKGKWELNDVSVDQLLFKLSSERMEENKSCSQAKKKGMKNGISNKESEGK